MRDATRAFGVPCIELDDWEADDLIASYACAVLAAGGRATIVSSDKDLMQLLRPGIDMLDPMKQKPIVLADVMDKFGVPPEKLIDAQALIGDSVDNVPGVPGIGPKTAAQLINEFGDLEGILAAAPAMKPSKRRDLLIEHADLARISRKLVTLCCEVPLPEPLEALVARDPDRDTLAAWLTAQGFRSIVSRLGLEGGSSAAVPATRPPPVRAGGAPQGALDFADTPPPAVPINADGYGPYETVTTLDALHGWVDAALLAGIVAVDTETDSLDADARQPRRHFARHRPRPRLLHPAAPRRRRADRPGRRARRARPAAGRPRRAEGAASTPSTT